MAFIITQFLNACKDGDLPKIKDMWSGSAKQISNIDVADSEGKTGLLNSVIGNRRDVLIYLINEGADINAKDKEERSALHHAANSNNKQMILLLLMNSIEASAFDKENKVAGADNGDLTIFINEVAPIFTQGVRGTPLFREA